MRRRGYFLGMFSLLLLGLGACMRPEKPWPRPQGAEMRTLAAPLGPEYDTIAFLSFSQGLVHRVPRMAWDLEVHSTGGGYHVWLNAAMYAFAVVVDSATWTSISEVSRLTGWRCDLIDTAALPLLGSGLQMTIILDRDKSGVIYTTPNRRYKKLWLKATENELEIRSYALTGALEGEWRVPRTSQPNYISLERPQELVSILPPWEVELILTRYIHYFSDQPEQFRYYPVVGALLPKGYRAAVVTTTQVAFEDFSYANLAEITWKTQRDAIGYDWKRYDFETGTYVIDFSRYYVLEAGIEKYYKLQFVDFYDESGRKGAVKIRYSPL